MTDIEGKELENVDQVLEIFPHDVVLPACPDTPDEKADDVVMNICNFVDDELEFLQLGLAKVSSLFNKVRACKNTHAKSPDCHA